VIIIEPSMGFGTGHHASTRLCLRLLQQVDLSGKTVLDVGTGSGVLAIAAHRLGAATVVAVDADADAIDSAARNLAANGIAAGIDLRHGDIRTLDAVSADVLLANLTGAILVDQALRLMTMIKPDGYWVASGFTTDEEKAVSSALRPHGTVSCREFEEDWVALLLQVHRVDLRWGTAAAVPPEP
jgi:ribosomal protein L11 methyltransferase